MSVFKGLIDQSAAVAVLSRAVVAARNNKDESQEMTHAWLFVGPPGSGRSNAAVGFAQALVCSAGGCGECKDCDTAKAGSHADVELMRTNGLSIKIDEVRELITRASWTPSVANYRVVVIEDADRLTESAANALLKAIEEPSSRTIWLLCAPTIFDVLPTVRSRTRVVSLRIPSERAVEQLLLDEGVSGGLAAMAAHASGGHIGRARYLATSETARNQRSDALRVMTSIKDVATAYSAAAALVERSKDAASSDAEARNEAETFALKEAWGMQGTRLVTGGAKAIKELEKDQKSRSTRMQRDYLDNALVDVLAHYRDELVGGSASGALLLKMEAIQDARAALAANSAPLLTIEALALKLI